MTVPAISVVVPLGLGKENVARRLERCLASVAGQTMGNIEIICVDGGKSKTSSEVCERLAANDSRCRIVAPIQNRDCGDLKNSGVLHAKGKYVAFVNPDDQLDPFIAQKTLAAAERERVDTIWVKTDGEENPEARFFNSLPGGTLRLAATDLWRYPTACWNKLYRKDFLLRNGLNWSGGARRGDDEFFFKCFVLSDRAYLVNECLYLRGNAEAEADADEKDAEALCRIGGNCRRFLDAHGLYLRHADALLDFIGQRIETLVASRGHKERLIPAVRAMLDELGHPRMCRGKVKRALFDAVRFYRRIRSLPKLTMPVEKLRRLVPVPALRYWLTVFCLENECAPSRGARGDGARRNRRPGAAGMAF